jgi:hypothetical protein
MDKISKNTSNFMKFRPVGGELFRADGQTDTVMTQLMWLLAILQTRLHSFKMHFNVIHFSATLITAKISSLRALDSHRRRAPRAVALGVM